MYGGKSTLYDALGLTRTAAQSDIIRTYRRLSAELKSEASAPNPRREALIHEAYEVLSDPQKRAAYDRSLQQAKFHGNERGRGPARKWGVLVAALGAAAGIAYYFMRPQAQHQAPGASLQEIQAAAALSVGRVNRIDMSGARSTLGTAVAIEEGVMMAPCEGIGPGAQILVRIPPRDIPAQVRSADESTGLCRLAVSGAGSWPLGISGQVPRVGDKVYAANLNPLGEVVVAAREVRRVVAGANGAVIETTPGGAAPADGSPLLDAQGRVVAIALKGVHTTLPAAWIVDPPIRARPGAEAVPADATPAAPQPAVPTAPEAKGKLGNVPAEKRDALEKAFRPTPAMPKDL